MGMSKKAEQAFKTELESFLNEGLLALYQDLQRSGVVKRDDATRCPLSYRKGYRGSEDIFYSKEARAKQIANTKKGKHLSPVTPRDFFLTSWDNRHATKSKLLTHVRAELRRRKLKAIRSPFR